MARRLHGLARPSPITRGTRREGRVDGIDEPLDAGVNAFAVWVLDPGAEFEILAPAFDETASWVDPGDGTELLIHVGTKGANQGKLVPAGTADATTAPVAPEPGGGAAPLKLRTPQTGASVPSRRPSR